MSALRAALPLLVAVSTGACARSPAPPEVPARDAGAPVQTDSLHYYLAQTGPGPARFWLTFTYANTSSDTVYHVACWGGLLPALERREGGRWVGIRAAATYPCVNLVTIPPHGLRRDSLAVCRPTSPTQSSCQPWQLEGIDGTYRLKLDAVRLHYDVRAGGDTLPEARRISNLFLITTLK